MFEVYDLVVGAKRQVTIPTALMKRLALKEGDHLRVKMEQHGVTLEPMVVVPRHLVSEALLQEMSARRGATESDVSLREFMAARRGTPTKTMAKAAAAPVHQHPDAAEVLLQIIYTLQNSQTAFGEMGEREKDPVLQRYFLSESLKRLAFRGELEIELHQQGLARGTEVPGVGVAGHRAWGDLKTMVTKGEESLLTIAEKGEDAAQKAYAEALTLELPLPLGRLIRTQQEHVVRAREEFAQLRSRRSVAEGRQDAIA